MTLGAVVCVYRTPFIERQLQSMVAQELPLDEIIVVDDSGSDEWAGAIAAGLVGFAGRAEVIRNQTNLGIRRSYELAISRCTTDVLFAADHDDEWLPEKTAVVMEALTSSGATGCFHDLTIFESSGFTVGEGNRLGRFFELYPGRASGSSDFASLLEMPMASGSTLVMRRDILPKPLRFPDSVYPDMFLQLLIARTGGLLRLDRSLGNYRRHDANLTPLPGPLDRLRRRTADPDDLVDALLGYSAESDAVLERYRLRMQVRRAVETGTLLRWIRRRAKAGGSRKALRDVASVYEQPWRFAADEARRIDALVSDMKHRVKKRRERASTPH